MGKSIYYYTDYETFKLIIQNGTLRFKQSTASNDCLDTIMLYSALDKLADDFLEKDNCSEALSYISKLYKYREFFCDRISMVACFTSKSDSRLLWDAYTMNRKDRKSERYNGVCIEFDEEII